MEHAWRVEEIDKWPLALEHGEPQTMDEPLGTKEKFWVRAADGQEFLFKYARVSHGRTMNEDWVEWAVHRLAMLLSIPTAIAIPALHYGRRGVLSRSILAPGDRLIHGNELLARSDPEYDTQVARENSRYTVEAVHDALDGIAPPPSCPAPIRTAFDAWAGYLVLDALVAGRDRHHENWAMIDRDGQLHLAPSFDHGNALGSQEPDSKAQTLTDDDAKLTAWARRGRSHHFAGRPRLVSLASAALDTADPGTREYWRSALAEVTDAEIVSLLRQVPEQYLSDIGRTFRVKLLIHNRERLLHGD